MTGKKNAKKSVVPLKLQIPLALLLAILFIFLLSSRLRGGKAAQGSPVPTVGDEAVTSEMAATDAERRVDFLIDKISEKSPGDQREHESLPDLPGDPFAEPDGTARGRALNTLDPRRRAQEQDDDGYNRRSREEFIASLILQATLIDGETRFALINGTLLGENDAIGQFNVHRIGERAAFLGDERGNVLLKMKGDDLL